MRIGQNPNRHADLPPFPRIVALVVTHLPDLSHPYHKTRFDVLRHSFKTLTDNIGVAPEDYDLIVWDNGSCEEVRDWLRGFTCKLFLSCNIGKMNALKFALSGLPPETIVAYGDDDIEYFPGWLAPQIQILETFPNVGAVTGWPVRIASKWGISSALRFGAEHAEMTQGRFIPREWEMDYCDSIGRDATSYEAATWGVPDVKIRYKGVEALATCQHCQFVGYAGRLAPLIQRTDKAMIDEIQFDEAIDKSGYLRLATVERLTRHIGNVLEKGLA